MTLFPKEYAFADSKLAAACGLPTRHGGWGLLFCVDEHGLRYTAAGDADYLRVLLGIAPGTVPGTAGTKRVEELFGESVELPAETFPLRRPGWPDQWTRG
ncbi:MAG TPA: hypothetical protein VLZ05_00615, partial [Mycobacterium sp.]